LHEWQKHVTESDAKRAAERAPVARQAQELGLTVKVAIREGRYDYRHEVEVTCETRPACDKHYLHRLRKTAATNWLRSGFDLMKIKNWLGHKSLEVTQIYLDAEMHDPEEQRKLDRAGKF
jgi:hypothetical protein